jgi:hypothetical protein
MHYPSMLTAPLATIASVAALAAPAAAQSPATGGQDLRSPDAIDAARTHTTAPPRVEFVPAQGFDWGDAAIGAAGATGLLAISAAGAMTLRRRRPGSQATRS